MTTPEQAIQDAMRVQTFLKDDVIAGVLSRLERAFYEEFVAADSSEKRVTAWAKATVLRKFEMELQIVMDAGEKEVLRIANETKKRHGVTKE